MIIKQHLEKELAPYPDRLSFEKSLVKPKFDILGELMNLCVKVPLLQAIRDVPMYAKKIWELNLKKTRMKKDPKTIQVIGKIFDLMSGNVLMKKYRNLRSHVMTINVSNTPIANTLIYLWESINVMTNESMENL